MTDKPHPSKSHTLPYHEFFVSSMRYLAALSCVTLTRIFCQNVKILRGLVTLTNNIYKLLLNILEISSFSVIYQFWFIALRIKSNNRQ